MDINKLQPGKEYYFDEKKSDFGIFVGLHEVYGAAMFTPVVNKNYDVFEDVVRISPVLVEHVTPKED